MNKRNEKVEFFIEACGDGHKLQAYLEKIKGISAKAVKRLKVQGIVLLNGIPVRMNASVRIGDRVVLIYPMTVPSPYVIPENVPLDVLYEDQWIMIVQKQPFLCVHPTKGHPTGTLANGILQHCKLQNETVKIHLVNRLDKDTSGLILIAKNAYSAQQLFKQQKDGKLRRSYLALVSGCIDEDRGSIDLSIGRVSGRTTKREVDPKGQRAVTQYQVLQRYQDQEGQRDYTFLSISLETGRTHQIRVHFSHLGHPLVGDEFYGSSKTNSLNRQFLHAYNLSFNHPFSQLRLDFRSKLPADLAGFIRELIPVGPSVSEYLLIGGVSDE